MGIEAPEPQTAARALPSGSSPIPEQHHHDYEEVSVTGWQAGPREMPILSPSSQLVWHRLPT